ncbi:MAG: hypothetical protein ABS910_02130 [Arthrobacter sp.]
MSKAKNALAAGALVLVLGASAAGISILGRTGSGEAEPYRTLVPAPSPTLSVPAEPDAPAQEYVAIPAPTATPDPQTPQPDAAPAPETSRATTQEPAGEATSSAAPVPDDPAAEADAEQLALASRAAWNPAEQNRVAAALAAADAYTAAHPGTAEAAVYSSVRAGLACGSAENSTTLVTRALRSAGYTFTGCGPEDILSWFAGHPDYAAVLPEASSARPGSLVIVRGPSGNAVIGVYLSDGLAVFGGDAAAAAGTVSDAAPARAVRALIAPADLYRTALLPAGTALEETPVYVRPAPFA